MKKRLRSPDSGDKQQPLIPGLPDHISHLCLSTIPPSLLFSVSSSWRRLLYSPLIPPFLSLYALLTPTNSNSPIQFMSYDPITASDWIPIPPPPLNLILRHPSFLSRTLSLQSLSVNSTLILLAGTIDSGDQLLQSLPNPLLFYPETGSWSHGPSLPAPRRWCAAGTLGGAVYVGSGIGSQFSDDVARSLEKWEVNGGAIWEPAGRMKDGRFSREAIEAVGCRGRLYMVNVKGSGAKQGAVYNVDGGEWEEMSEAMVKGWRGPAASIEEEEEMYVVDVEKGVLLRWDWGEGKWEEVVETILLRGAQQITGVRGKVCVVVEGVGGVVVVDVKVVPVRVWVVETPPGYDAIAVHVLPRMCPH